MKALEAVKVKKDQIQYRPQSLLNLGRGYFSYRHSFGHGYFSYRHSFGKCPFFIYLYINLGREGGGSIMPSMLNDSNI